MPREGGEDKSGRLMVELRLMSHRDGEVVVGTGSGLGCCMCISLYARKGDVVTGISEACAGAAAVVTGARLACGTATG